MNDTFSQQMNDVLNTPFCHFCLELNKHAVIQHSSSYFINNGSRKKLRSDKLSGTKQNWQKMYLWQILNTFLPLLHRGEIASKGRMSYYKNVNNMSEYSITTFFHEFQLKWTTYLLLVYLTTLRVAPTIEHWMTRWIRSAEGSIRAVVQSRTLSWRAWEKSWKLSRSISGHLTIVRICNLQHTNWQPFHLCLLFLEY